MSDYNKIQRPDKNPKEKYQTKDGFTNWYDQRTWGTEKGSLGMKKETQGHILRWEEFSKKSSSLQDNNQKMG